MTQQAEETSGDQEQPPPEPAELGGGVGLAGEGVGLVGEGAALEGAPPHSPAGLGVDIIEITRMQQAFDRVPVMKERLFSTAEADYAESKARPIVHYALFFAAKEAVLKALGTGLVGMGWTDVEVRHDTNGRPYVQLSGAAQAEAERQRVVSIELSLSYTHQVGVASAVAIRETDKPSRVEAVDSKAELLRQFKELRHLLDEMDSGDDESPETAQLEES